MNMLYSQMFVSFIFIVSFFILKKFRSLYATLEIYIEDVCHGIKISVNKF